MSSTIERFSNRVANYVKYRPDYPREIIAWLEGLDALSDTSVVADIGCGPGISSRMFLENGNRVIGVEPNAAMRSAAESEMAAFPNFSVVDGTSEETSLSDASVDLVVAAQAFHWFEPKRTRDEFSRILRSGGAIVLIWNERQLDTTPFLIEYEQFLLKYATDYEKVRHENVDHGALRTFFGNDYYAATFQNLQEFDLEGLRGRLLSASYMPSETDAVFAHMADDLRALFAKHSENDRIKVFYDTNVYCARA